MVDESTSGTLSNISLLKTNAGPRENEQWMQRLTGEYQSLIQGVVTNVEVSLLYFEVNDELRIYINLLANPEELTFPSIGDVVEIRNMLVFDEFPLTVGIMGPETTYNFPTKQGSPKQLFWTLRRNDMLADPEEILRMNRFISKFDKHFPNLIHKFLIKILDMDTVKKGKSFKDIEVKFPDDLNYVNEGYSKFYDFLEFDGLCTFNVYPSQNSEMSGDSIDQLLFGILDVDNTTGLFTLLSDKSQERLPIKFKPYSGDLYKFNNTMVMIKKWTVFTEIFKMENVSTLKYILIDFMDVVIVERIPNKLKLFYGRNDMTCPNTPDYELFLIEKLSEPIFGYTNQPELWMEGLLMNIVNNRPQRVYLCYPNVANIPFLKENVVYKIIKARRTITDKNPQLFGLKSKHPIFNIDKNTLFQETANESCLIKEKLLNGMLQIKAYMTSGISQNEYFSCVIKISKKHLQQYKANFKPFHPRRFKRPMPYFGNPDDDHQMQVVCYDSERDMYLDLYVNQRDSSVTPLGLVEDMVVKITHIQQSKGRYLRSSVFTTYEILDYCPKIPFSSVPLRLVDLDRLSFSKIPSTPLGMYFSLPKTCIVASSFMFRSIFDLSVIPVCDECKKRVVAGSECAQCHTIKRDLHIEIVINGQDFRHPTVTVGADKNFLFAILGLRNDEHLSFINSFFKCDKFKVDFTKKSNFDPDLITKDAKSRLMLSELIETIFSHINNNRLISLFNIACVKKFDHPDWQMVAFEAIYNSKFCE